MRLNDDGKTVAAMDVLVPKVGELIGGSQREERLEVSPLPHELPVPASSMSTPSCAPIGSASRAASRKIDDAGHMPVMLAMASPV